MPNPEANNASAANAEARQPRQSRLVKAALENDRLGRFDITVRNVSESGIGGRAPHKLSPGDRFTVFLPGQPPMQGIVRWAYDHSFGMETAEAVRIERLRAAHGGSLPSADSAIEFRIIPPTNVDYRRPALKLGSKGTNEAGKSHWSGT